MIKHGNTAGKSCLRAINVTNRALRANDRTRLLVALLLQAVLIGVLISFWKSTQQSFFCSSARCIAALFGWSISIYLRKWTGSEKWYYGAIGITGLFALVFVKNLIDVVRVASQSISCIASCIACIRSIDTFLNQCPFPEIIEALVGATGVVAYLVYVYKRQHSVPKPEWNPYTHWTIHSQRMYFLVCEICAACAICYVIIEHYGYLLTVMLSLAVIFFVIGIYHDIRDRWIAQDDSFPISNICRYLFDHSGLTHNYSEIEQGGRCVQLIKAIMPLVKQKSEQHEASMTVLCITASMVYEHLRNVFDHKKKNITEKQREREASIYSFAIGVAGAMVNPEYSETQYKEYYEKRWRIIYSESQKNSAAYRTDLLFGFACGTCLSIIVNLNNGYTEEEIIEQRISIASRMIEAAKGHKVFLVGLDAELRNRGEKKLSKKAVAFLQPNKHPNNAIVLDRSTVKAIFDAVVDV